MGAIATAKGKWLSLFDLSKTMRAMLLAGHGGQDKLVFEPAVPGPILAPLTCWFAMTLAGQFRNLGPRGRLWFRLALFVPGWPRPLNLSRSLTRRPPL